MINIIFRSQTISFDNDNLNLQYFDSGDLHGNDNFRIPDKNPPVYEILNRIDPILLQSALAAAIDGQPVPLTAKISKDCTLDIITLDDITGKQIFHHSLAFLIAQTIFETYPTAALQNITVSNTNCVLQFAADFAFTDCTILKEQLLRHLQTNIAIQRIDAFQKEMLVETYSSLLQPYAQTMLAQYDDYDFVPVAARQNFVLPVQEQDLFVTNTAILKDFSLDIQSIAQGFVLTAAYQKQ